MKMPCFDSYDKIYTFYYDESGNDRKFYIREDFSGYNTQRKSLHFFLGGVAHHGNTTNADPDILFKALKLAQGEELKAAVFGKGEFPDIIGRKKIGIFFEVDNRIRSIYSFLPPKSYILVLYRFD